MARADKTERLMNLTICLLSTKRYVSKDDVRAHVQGYVDLTDQAFERMFERDKEDLRALGVPIETGSNDAYFDDEYGYRIRPGDFELPPVEFDPAETAVLGLAGRAWREASLASSTQSALAKLRAVGVEVDTQRLPELEPVVTVRETGFGIWYDAVIDRARVTFDYADRGLRTLEPWGLTSHRGRWYVIGRDVDKDDVRMFRLSRINGTPRRKGRPDAYTVPEGTNLRELARALDPAPETQRAVVAVRPQRAAGLRRRGEPLPEPVTATPEPVTATPESGTATPEGFEVFGVGFASRSALVAELASYGSDVVVLEPPELRAELVAHLQAWLADPASTERSPA